MTRQTKFGFTIEPAFCVLYSILDQGDVFVNGPFATRDEARKWAEENATDYNLDTGHELERDDDEGAADWITANDDNDEPIREWSVFTMVRPRLVQDHEAENAGELPEFETGGEQED